ncbi:hypothetical protein DYB28_002093 [Aphanomyces astaci]|nr:hypothetical protein DYB36_001967 [Aphanomyces astaci]RHY10385.1 hypothetical protein DYB25_004805 [Aphanomyces astaci]RHY57515.1 hypothetical protein DYB38_001171 [Aphanomyces astaci]RHY78199.1 hypothetical protein DYB34_002016 [Aphanomyces astaci]RHY78732.1 hypothetical protein DYB30_011680 [Aphanomyces astaci]
MPLGIGRRSISLLHLNASISEDSATSVVSMGLMACVHQQSLRAAWTQKKNIVVNSSSRQQTPFRVIERDLWSPDLPKFCKDTMRSTYRVLQGEGTSDDLATISPIQHLAQELLEADCVVVSTPVWNHSVPYVLKQYMDCVVQPDLTYSQATQEPFVTGRTFVLISSAGGDIREQDTTFALVESVFQSVGFNHGHVISLQGLKESGTRAAQLDAALYEAERIAQRVVEHSLV